MRLWLWLPVTALALCACALDGAAGDEPALASRALVDAGGAFLSDRVYNDRAPQIVDVFDGFTNRRFLFFLSDRPAPGGQAGTSLCRAREVAPGRFAELSNTFLTNAQVGSLAVPNAVTAPGLWPQVYVSMRTGTAPFQVYRLTHRAVPYDTETPQVMINTNTPGDIHLAGRHANGWFFVRCAGPAGMPLLKLAGLAGTTLTNWPGRAPYPVGLMARQAGFTGAHCAGGWPLDVPRGDKGSVFGALVNVGPRLALAVNLLTYRGFDSRQGSLPQSTAAWLNTAQPVADYDQAVYFRADRVVPLTAVAHAPGARDSDPFWDPATGLYFASDREGSFDLYWVPKSFIRVPDAVR